jgi:D-psicose/D-tagatose/L-ribulose 3-epimerase
MKLGVSAFAWAGKIEPWLLDLLPAIRNLGMDGFEIPMFDPTLLPAAEIRSAFEQSSLECTVCAILPAGINPISPDAGVREKALRHLKRCVEMTACLGAKLLGGPLYAPIGYFTGHRPTADELQWATEAFQSLGETLDACGVTIAIEPVNRSETFFVRTAKEALALCQAVDHPRVGVTIDTFHANIEEKNPAAAILSLSDRLRHMHISENDRSLLGQGHVDFPGIVDALRTIRYQGYLMIEGFGFLPEVKDGPGTLWAECNVSPMEIATQGAAYLRSLLHDPLNAH